MGAAAAQRSDVEGREIAKAGDQGRIVELRIVGQGHDRGARVRSERRQRFVGPFVRQGDLGKSLAAREGSPRIHHDDLVARHRGHRHEHLRNVDGTDHHEPQRWIEHVHEDRAGTGLDAAGSVTTHCGARGIAHLRSEIVHIGRPDSPEHRLPAR